MEMNEKEMDSLHALLSRAEKLIGSEDEEEKEDLGNLIREIIDLTENWKV